MTAPVHISRRGYFSFRALAIAAALVLGAFTFPARGQQAGSGEVSPDATYLFAVRDTCELLMDVYEPREKGPADEVSPSREMRTPTVLFVFGGGFITGRRDAEEYLPWFGTLTGNGYRVISIDYRLGLKGQKNVGVKQVNELDAAIHMAVEDLFSATAYIVENADALGVDPERIVVAGSSAGAITVLQAAYEISRNTYWTDALPAGFSYAGVMSFAGGILSRRGKLDYSRGTCPTLLFHGTADKVVNYKQIKVFKLGFFGSDKIAGRLAKYGQSYRIYRYPGHEHEIASSMTYTIDEQLDFLRLVGSGETVTLVDSTVTDSGIPVPEGMSRSRKELYGGK